MLNWFFILKYYIVQETAPPSSHSAFSGHHLPFVGFTFSKECALSDVMVLREVSGMSSAAGVDEIDTLAARAYEKRLLKLEQENKELSRKLIGKLGAVFHASLHTVPVKYHQASAGKINHKISNGYGTSINENINIFPTLLKSAVPVVVVVVVAT